jgi:dihydrolipoamide dehydrogenase
MMERKGKVVSVQVKGIRGLFKSWGITLREGKGTLMTPRSIEVEKSDGTKETVEADRIIIATGSRPANIPGLPFDGERILSSDNAVTVTEIPKRILIVGAGVIGCEYACIFSELGAEVIMVEMLSRAVSSEDIEISEYLEKEFRKKKIKLMTGVKVERIQPGDDGMHVVLSDGKGLVTDKVLVSVGRSLNSGDIGLEHLGIAKGEKGEILVDKRMETNVKGIYAVGDVVGGMLLAHKASQEGIVAASNACGTDMTIDYSIMPAAVFTSPEIASVGLREQDAAGKGISIKTGHFPVRALGRAHATGEISGLFKIIADARTDKILGAHIIGPHASDLIHEIAVAMKAGLAAKDIAETIHAHPTFSEGIREAAEDVLGEAIHVPKK